MEKHSAKTDVNNSQWLDNDNDNNNKSVDNRSWNYGTETTYQNDLQNAIKNYGNFNNI